MNFQQHIVINSSIRLDDYFSLDSMDIFISFIVYEKILYKNNWYGLIGITSRDMDIEDEDDWINNSIDKVDELCLGYYDELSDCAVFDRTLPLKDVDLPFIDDIKKYIIKELIKMSI